MKHIHFYAVKEDLLPLLEIVDSKGPLKYARMGNFSREELKNGICVFASGAALPNLGKATADSSAACEAFLVCDREATINPRAVQAVDGERICVDQLANPDSVVFKPGGIWNEEILLEGSIGTASESQASQALMKRFQAAIKKTFTKVKAFYVGPKALALLKSGKRLTISAQSPPEFDLTLDSAKD